MTGEVLLWLFRRIIFLHYGSSVAQVLMRKDSFWGHYWLQAITLLFNIIYGNTIEIAWFQNKWKTTSVRLPKILTIRCQEKSFIKDHKKSEKFNCQSPQILNRLNHKPIMKARTPIPNSAQGYSTFFSEKILHPETEISPGNVHWDSKKQTLL